MKISRAVFRQEIIRYQQHRVCSKKLSSKATAIFARGAYWHYVSTEKWRERRWRLFSTDPKWRFNIMMFLFPLRLTLLLASSQLIFTGLAFADDSFDGLEGVWRREGYGEILTIDKTHVVLYQVTNISCYPVESIERTAAAKGLAKIRVNRRGTRLNLREVADLNLQRYRRLRSSDPSNPLLALPRHCQEGGTARTSGPIHNFDVFWHTFAENYPFFVLNSVDWQEQYDRFRPFVHTETTPEDLQKILVDMALPLDDGHASLLDTQIRSLRPVEERLVKEWFQFHQAEFPEFIDFLQLERATFDHLFASRYLDSEMKDAANDQIQWGFLQDHIGYLRIDSMDDYSNSGDPKDDLDEARRTIKRVIKDFSGASAVVIDLRWNSGGMDETGLLMASWFNHNKQVAFSKRAKDEKGFTRPQFVKVKSRGRKAFRGPIFILTSGITASAAEVFILTLRARGHVVVIGEKTAGAFSDAMIRILPNGWEFNLSNEVYLDRQNRLFEKRGIPVEVTATFFEATDRKLGIDPAIEELLAHVSNSHYYKRRR